MRIASDATHEGDALTPSDEWEIVQVDNNNGAPGSGEELSVSVHGVREVQWPDCFVWGERVPDRGAATAGRDKTLEQAAA